MTEIPHDEIRIDTFDPGIGGFCNRNYQGVRIVHIPTGTEVKYSAHRSQHVNRAIAMDMLLAALTHPRHP